MNIFKLRSAEDVFKRFLAFPEELEVIIDNKKLGLSNPRYGRWDEYSLEVLERGMALIKRKKRFDFYKNAGEIIFSVLFVVIESYLVFKGLKENSPELVPVVIKNLQLIALTAIPALFIWETFTASFSLEQEKPIHIRTLRRGVRIMILIIIVLDLTNLIVGA